MGSEENIESHELLDASGLTCPLPLLKAKQMLNRMAASGILEVVCTDPGSVRDFQVFSEQSGHRILKAVTGAEEYRYWIQKRADS